MASYRNEGAKEENPFESFIVDMLLQRMQGMSMKDRADLLFLLHGRVSFPEQGFMTWQ